MVKGGAKVCPQPVNVLGPLVTEFARNLGRKGATPIQRSFHSGLLGRIQAVKFIRHNTSRIFRAAPTAVGRLLRAAQINKSLLALSKKCTLYRRHW